MGLEYIAQVCFFPTKFFFEKGLNFFLSYEFLSLLHSFFVNVVPVLFNVLWQYLYPFE